jgi:hypothetical protein
MPRLSQNEIEEECMENNADELVIVGAPTHPGRVTISVPANNGWRAPSLNLAAARAVRHREILLGRSMTKEEQDAFIKKLCEPR